jgi:hypothetical protein
MDRWQTEREREIDKQTEWNALNEETDRRADARQTLREVYRQTGKKIKDKQDDKGTDDRQRGR